MAAWIKLYTETLSDPKMGRMSDHLYRRTIELFMIAGTVNLNGILPDVEDIAWMLHTSAKDIRETVEALSGLGILTVSGQKITVTHFAERQMSNLTEAERKAAYRDKQRTKLDQLSGQCPDDMSGQCPDTCPDKSPTPVPKMSRPEVEVEVEEEVDKELKRESREKAPAPKPAREVKQKYGQFGNVLLTPNEYAKLCERFPDADGRIEHFSKKKAAKGYTYKSDYAALLSWADDKAERAQAQALPQPKKTYTFAEVGEMMERGEIPA